MYNGRKYAYNIKSQRLKLLVIFPVASALAVTLFYHVFDLGTLSRIFALILQILDIVLIAVGVVV